MMMVSVYVSVKEYVVRMLLSFAVAPEPEVGCTIELFVLAATREKERKKVVETVQEILAGILPTSNTTVNDTIGGGASLTTVYNSLTEEFGERRSDSGYRKFVEAINEITEAKQEACMLW